MLARAAVRRLEDRWKVGALGQPRRPRCAREPLEGAAVPRSLARSLAPPKPPHSRLEKPRKGRGGALRGRFRLQFTPEAGKWGGGGGR